MARDEAPPFARGETFYNGGTIDTTNLGGPNLEGKEYTFEVNAPDGYAQNDPSGRRIRVKVVRNTSGQNLLPKRLARFAATSPHGCYVDGYVSAPATEAIAGVIDEFLPAAGVVNNDLFYVVIEGPTTVQSVASGLSNIAIGDRVEAASGTSATSSDAGRINKYAGSPTAADVVAIVGRADQAQTSTSADTKINARVFGR
jgi:hypothetical protein